MFVTQAGFVERLVNFFVENNVSFAAVESPSFVALIVRLICVFVGCFNNNFP
jgi:hypothetical protein